MYLKLSGPLYIIALPLLTNRRESGGNLGLRMQRDRGKYHVGHIPTTRWLPGEHECKGLDVCVMAWGGKNQGILLSYFSPGPGVGGRLQREGLMGRDLVSRERE